METVVHAYAKLNLTLDVTGCSQDGYHNMLMIMQGVSLCDDIRISAVRGTGEIRIHSGLPYVPSDERNIAAKSARLFLEEHGINGYDINIDIKKRIPVCAGLGGGSSDAAAVLRAMNAMFGTGQKADGLRAMALKIGSDVPYCVEFGTMRAEGRGEILTRLPDMPECSIVVCKPRFSVSTPELFRELDMHGVGERPDTDAAEAALAAGDLAAIGKKMFNVFEKVLGARRETIESIKESLMQGGALGAVMSGTGSAVFGVFDDDNFAKDTAESLTRKWDDVFLCRTITQLNV